MKTRTKNEKMSALQTIVANAGPKSKQKAKPKAKEQGQAKSKEIKPKCDCAIQLKTPKDILKAIEAERQVFKFNELFYTQCSKSKLDGEDYCSKHLSMFNEGKIIQFSKMDGKEEIKDVNDPSIRKKRGPKKKVNEVPDELQPYPELIERFNQETAEVDNETSAQKDVIDKEASLKKDEIKKRLIQEALQRASEQAAEQEEKEVSSEEETEELIVEEDEPKSAEDEEPKSEEEEDEEPNSAEEKEVPIETLLTISDKQGREFKLVNNTVKDEDDEVIGELVEVSYEDAPIELKGKNYIVSEIINFKDEKNKKFILDKLSQSVYRDIDGTINYHGKTKTNSKGNITKIIAVKSK